jgi:hypothetical protein
MKSPTTKPEVEAAPSQGIKPGPDSVPSDKSKEPARGPRGEDFDDVPRDEKLERYGGGHITSWPGRIDSWLLVVYVVLFLWALYYGYVYWGGLGPGLDYSVK